MYNQPRPLRPEKPWQAAANLMPQSERRSFASAQWGTDEPDADGFEAMGLRTEPKDFSAMRVEPMMHPLPKHIMTALALLDEAQQKHEQSDPFVGPTSTDPQESDNSHLPFVPMVYQAVDWSGKPIIVQPEPEVLVPEEALQPTPPLPTQALVESENQDEANLQDDLGDANAQGNDASSEQEQADSTRDLQAQPDEVQAQDLDDLPAALEVQELAQDDAFPVQALTDQELEAVDPESTVGAQTLEGSEFVESELNDAQEMSPAELEADAQDIEQQVQSDLEPEVEPTPGVQEEEVLQREQAQYAKGLEEGERQAREALQEEVDAKKAVLDSVTQQLNELLNDASKLYEPIKRLSMHLAEQIVLGELNTPTAWVERMIQRCLDEVHVPAQGLVVVELNARDKQRLETEDSKLLKSVRLEINDDIQPGSVRVLANGMVIEEFLSHRLAGLVRSLAIDESAWRAQSSLVNPQESLQEMESDDDHHS